jgi:hypothetical protein
VSDGHFTTFNIPLLAGRDFDDRDSTGSQKVAIVNEEFAAQFAGGRSPSDADSGESTPNEPETLYEIVGYVRNTKYQNLREELRPLIFLADSQRARSTYARDPDSDATAAGHDDGRRQRALAEVNPKIAFTITSIESTRRADPGAAARDAGEPVRLARNRARHAWLYGSSRLSPRAGRMKSA